MLNFSYVKYTEFHIHVGNVCADIHMENNQDSIYHEEKYTGRLLNMKYFIFHIQKSAPYFHMINLQKSITHVKIHHSGFHMHESGYQKRVPLNIPDVLEEKDRGRYGSSLRMGGTRVPMAH